MLPRKVFWSVTVAITILGVGSGALIGGAFFATRPVARAAWKEVYRAPSQLARDVDAIILAKAVSVQPSRVAFSTNREDALPFEAYEFEVVRGLKGVKPGERVFVERAGGIAPDGRTVRLDIDGGAYELGATYLLFLKQQEDGPYFYQVNDQGRFLVAQGRLWATSPDDKVAAFFEGRRLSEGLGLVRGFLNHPSEK